MYNGLHINLKYLDYKIQYIYPKTLDISIQLLYYKNKLIVG